MIHICLLIPMTVFTAKVSNKNYNKIHADYKTFNQSVVPFAMTVFAEKVHQNEW